MRRSKIIAIGLMAGTLVIILLLAFQSTRPYVGVDEVVANPSKFNQQEIQVIGVVRDFAGTDFNLTENTSYILVDPTGASIPDNFTNGLQIVVKGIFNAPSTLHATLIILQCSQSP